MYITSITMVWTCGSRVQHHIPRPFISVDLLGSPGICNRNLLHFESTRWFHLALHIYWPLGKHHHERVTMALTLCPRITIYLLDSGVYQLFDEKRKLQLKKGVMREDDIWPKSWNQIKIQSRRRSEKGREAEDREQHSTATLAWTRVITQFTWELYLCISNFVAIFICQVSW